MRSLNKQPHYQLLPLDPWVTTIRIYCLLSRQIMSYTLYTPCKEAESGK